MPSVASDTVSKRVDLKKVLKQNPIGRLFERRNCD